MFVTKNLIDQPTSCCDTNGTNLRLNTLMLCLWGFFCMHANHVYKAAVFSSSNFEEHTAYPKRTKEIIMLSWEKYTTTDYNNGVDKVPLKCQLHFLSADLANGTNYLKEITKDVICNLQYEEEVVYSMNEWPLSNYRSRKKNSAKLENLIMVNPTISLRQIKLGLNA